MKCTPEDCEFFRTIPMANIHGCGHSIAKKKRAVELGRDPNGSHGVFCYVFPTSKHETGKPEDFCPRVGEDSGELKEYTVVDSHGIARFKLVTLK